MSKIVLHCIKPEERKTIMEHANSFKLQTTIPHEHNPHATEIKGDSKQLEEFVKHYESNENIAIFYDDDHPKAGKNKFKPHLCKAKDATHHIQSRSSNYGNTAPVLAQHYNFPPQNRNAPVIAVISLGGNVRDTDLVYYWHNICGISKWANLLNVYIDGAHPKFTGSDADMENTLDTEIIGAICPGATILLYSAPNTDTGFYNAISHAISGSVVRGKAYHPSIISISWGGPENYWSSNVLNAFDQAFAVAQARNITVCVASGDNGSTDGEGDGIPHVDFPASSPHVVSCGGTSLTNPESTWSYNPSYGWGTGGGISSFFPEPAYQIGVVTYPTNTNPSTTNLIGHRASPDIALNADPLTGWTIYFNGQAYVNQIGGTSCVAPAMSALLGLMNLNYVLGFNTSLYNLYKNNVTKANSFYDITTGSNDNINGSTGVWNAGVGYDFCTGLGTLNGTGLFNALRG